MTDLLLPQNTIFLLTEEEVAMIAAQLSNKLHHVYLKKYKLKSVKEKELSAICSSVTFKLS